MTAIAQKVGCSWTCERPSLVFRVDVWVGLRILRGFGGWILVSVTVKGPEKRVEVQVRFWWRIIDSMVCADGYSGFSKGGVDSEKNAI